MGKKKRILLTNDDGFSSPGIHHIYTVLKKKYAITVVAPEQEQSGIGHAFTYHKPITFCERLFQGNDRGYSVSGTPADCIKIALGHILSEKPDVIVSGINNGNNTGIAGYYSGTVAAAREGAFWQVPSIAFSISDGNPEFFVEYASVSCNILQTVLFENAIKNEKSRIFFNVNFPLCHPDECAGVKVTRQSLSFYDDKYTPVKKDNGIVEYWLHAEKKDVELTNDYDAYAIERNYITITPLHIDATASESLVSLSEIEKILEPRRRLYE